MRPLVSFLLLVTLLSAPITQASAQSVGLPAVDAAFTMSPLTVDQLDPAERVSFGTLAPGSDDARKFLYTRGFLRFARQVIAGTLPAPQLPNLPERANYDRRFLSPEEDRIVEAALYRFLTDPNSRSVS